MPRPQLQKFYDNFLLMWSGSLGIFENSLNNSNMQPGLRTIVGKKATSQVCFCQPPTQGALVLTAKKCDKIWKKSDK